MIALRIGDIWNFPFIDPPAPKSISDGFAMLTELNALTLAKNPSQKQARPEYQLTSKGRKMARIPIDPRLSRMLLEARGQGCEKEILVIASALSIMDPKERPMEKTQSADAAHAVFTHPSSDFIGLLNIWTAFHLTWKTKKTQSQMRKYCKDNFLSYKRMREWRDVHSQLQDILNEDDPPQKAPPPKSKQKNDEDALYAAIHKSILSGFLSNIALKKEQNFYTAAKGREVMMFPGSALFNKAKPWIVCAEIVETNRVYARTAAGIDPAWLEPIGRSNCRYTYSHPRWDRKRGEVVATEQVTLFGLIIASGRKVSYGRINPDEAGSIFIQSALVEAQLEESRLGFMIHNQRLMDQARDMENRLRRKDVLVDDTVLFSFYEKRLKGCYSIKTLKKKIKEASGDDFLKMTNKDILQYVPDQDDLKQYPDAITLGNRNLGCEYAFEPGKEADGVTVKIPAAIAPSIPADEMDWLVPGLFKEKITALIKGLPKNIRKQLIPISDTVNIIVTEMPKEKGPLLTLLAKFIYTRFQVDIPHSRWSESQLPEHLNMRISVVGQNGKEIKSSRDKSILSQSHAEKTDTDLLDPIRKRWERAGITQWDFPDLPESIDHTTADGSIWTLFPGLCVEFEDHPTGTVISLRLFSDAQKAITSHRAGVAGLYEIYFSKDLKFLKKALTVPDQFKRQSQLFGGKKEVENRLYHEVMTRLFARNIRTKKDFKTHGEKSAAGLLNNCHVLMEQTLPVLNAYYETCMALEALQKENRFNTKILKFIQDIMDQASRLVPKNFISIYAPEKLGHLERYLKALVIRAKRAILAPEKDHNKLLDLTPHIKHLEHLLATLSPNASDEKRAALEAYFWLIEEYKVSIFAQELKTAMPVSPKILKKKFEEIQRMA